MKSLVFRKTHLKVAPNFNSLSASAASHHMWNILVCSAVEHLVKEALLLCHSKKASWQCHSQPFIPMFSVPIRTTASTDRQKPRGSKFSLKLPCALYLCQNYFHNYCFVVHCMVYAKCVVKNVPCSCKYVVRQTEISFKRGDRALLIGRQLARMHAWVT